MHPPSVDSTMTSTGSRADHPELRRAKYLTTLCMGSRDEPANQSPQSAAVMKTGVLWLFRKLSLIFDPAFRLYVKSSWCLDSNFGEVGNSSDPEERTKVQIAHPGRSEHSPQTSARPFNFLIPGD